MISPSEASPESNSEPVLAAPVSVAPSSSTDTPETNPAAEEAVTSTTNTNTSLDIDPSQLVFHLGLSPSPSKDSWPHAFASPSSVNSSVCSSSSDRAGVPDLFGTYVRATASNLPRRFKFEASDGGRQPSAPDAATCPARHKVQPQPPPIIPNLGPHVTIRPVSAKTINPKKFEAKKNPQQKPNLDSNEIYKLLSGYNHLSTEVDLLKTQLAEKESLIHEILGNFSTEVSRLNGRLAAVEKELKKARKKQNVETQEDIATQLNDMSLIKKGDDSD